MFNIPKMGQLPTPVNIHKKKMENHVFFFPPKKWCIYRKIVDLLHMLVCRRRFFFLRTSTTNNHQQGLIRSCLNIWVNCNNSLTWHKATWGWFPLLTEPWFQGSDRFGGPATASRRAVHMVTFGGLVLKKKYGFLGENDLYSLIVPLWTLPSGVDMWVSQWNMLFYYPSVYDLHCTFFNTFIVTFPHLLVTFAGTYFCCEWLDHRPRS